jgi:hypothetical protein
MSKARSSLWKTILPAMLLGLIITLVVMFGTTMLGIFVSPMPLLLGLFIAAGVAAWRFPQQRTRLLSMIAGGIAGLAVFGVVIVLLLSEGLFSTTIQDDFKPAELEKWIGLYFPSSAINIRSHAEGFQDWQVFVRFEMPKADVKAFLRINKLEPESDPNTHLTNADLVRDWWTPDGTTKPRLFVPKSEPGATTKGNTKTGFYPTIQISDLEGGLVTVYISAFNT